MSSDALEVLLGEREEPHRRARDDRGRPLSRQQEPDLTERVAGAESLGRLTARGQDIGVAVFDEVDRCAVVVDRDDLCTRLDLDFAHHGGKLVELRCGKLSCELKVRDPTRVHGADRATVSNRSLNEARRRPRRVVSAALVPRPRQGSSVGAATGAYLYQPQQGELRWM